MAMMIGMLFILPTIEIQAMFGLITLCATGITTVDADVEGFAVLILFFWWIRDTHFVYQKILSYFVDDSKPSPKPPPWMDPAPYMPNGDSYGYAMSQY